MERSDFIEQPTTTLSFVEDFEFIPHPKIKAYPYTSDKTVPLYSNLYKLNFTKSFDLYEYSLKFNDTDTHLSTGFRKKIISKINKELKKEYGSFFFTGSSIFSTNKIKEVKNFNIDYKSIDYLIFIQPTENIINLKEMTENNSFDQHAKTVVELLIKDILKANKFLKFFKNLYGKKIDEKTINSKNNSVSLFPGFTTKVLSLPEGLFLNVDIKNKILSADNCLTIMSKFCPRGVNVTNTESYKKLNNYFKDRCIETTHTNQKMKIESISRDRTPKNTALNLQGEHVNLVKFYKKVFNIDLNPDQPLFIIKKKNDNDNRCITIPPQVCLLSGLTDDMSQDFHLMRDIADYTKMKPENKVSAINDVLRLLKEKEKIIKVNPETKETITYKSPFEKLIEYGLEIKSITSLVKGRLMDDPVILAKKDSVVKNISRPFDVLDSKPIKSLIFYHPLYKYLSDDLIKLMNTAGEGYGIKNTITDAVPVKSEVPSDWITEIKKKFTKKYNIVIVILDDYMKGLGFYEYMKKFSLEGSGYPFQIILEKSITSKNKLSIVSNILLQCNTKIGGSSYKMMLPKEIQKKNLMIIGVDTSHRGDDRTAIAMCATIDGAFTQYYNKNEIVKESNNSIRILPIASFIKEAIAKYHSENDDIPGGIVIYRQGVSKEQKYQLINEIKHIDYLLKGTGQDDTFKDTPIPYYYVLVNKKTSLKFFEISKDNRYSSKDNFENPEPGLLVAERISDLDVFEFFIQPQKVNSGSATPTCFHVAYGDLNCPEIIPKLTYDLCYLYCNWRGPVRIPAPLKYAEKLSKTMSKVGDSLHNNAKTGLLFI